MDKHQQPATKVIHLEKGHFENGSTTPKPIQDHRSDAVQNAIDEAVSAACEILDKQFPGCDQCGITSNFQGMLGEQITKLLWGGQPGLPRLIESKE